MTRKETSSYIELRGVVPSDSVDVEEGVTAELDGEGHIVALEVLDASRRLTAAELASVHYENLLLTAAGPVARHRRARAAPAKR